MYNDNFRLKKRETITNGKKYDFFIYEILHLEKKYKVVDVEYGKKLDVKFRCSKKLLDALEVDPKEAKKVLNKCLKELLKDGQITV